MTVTSTFPPSGMRYQKSSLVNISHGMFNCHKGKSSPPYSSLNLSYGVGDDPEHVTANRQIIKAALGIPYLLSAGQIHGDKIFCSSSITSDIEKHGYDALITDQKGVGLLIQQADCQAILVYDPIKEVIAAIHCGWRGSALNIIRTTIQEMQRRYHVNPAHLLTAISPSLGPCCAEFVNHKKELPDALHRFQNKPNHFNFWDFSVYQLAGAGVLPENIDAARICTVCDKNYFSYRRSNSEGERTTGRNGSVICMPFA